MNKSGPEKLTHEELEELAKRGDISAEATAIRLAAARKLAGFTQKSFADELGINVKTYNSMERRGAPSREVMLVLHVTSRKVVGLFSEQLWFEFVPVLHGLQGRFAAQG